MEHALSLPEIRRNICLYLRYRDYKSCALVSRAWHESVVLWIWRSVKIRKEYPAKRLATIHKYRSYVRTLYIKWDRTPVEIYEWFNRLQDIHIHFHSDKDITMDPIVALIRRNRSSLRSIYGCLHANDNVSLLIVLPECLSLVSLHFLHIRIQDRDTMESFIQICSRLTTLNLVCLNVSDSTYPMLQDQVFTNIKHIKFIGSHEHIQLELLRTCPNLRSLLIYPEIYVSVGTLLDVLINYCKQLCVIQFGDHREYERVDYDELALGLWPMKSLHWLSTPQDGFEVISVLTRHFQTLQALQLPLNEQLLGKAAQIILSSCPNLRSFKGGNIYASDIEAGKAWVCQRVQHLELQVLVPIEEPHLHSVVCGRLSELTQLSHLNFGILGEGRSSLPTSHEVLSLRLGDGLELMGSLKRLESFGVGYLRDYWKVEEIKWMYREWPSLGAIYGKYYQGNDGYRMLRRRLGQSWASEAFPNIEIMDFIEF